MNNMIEDENLSMQLDIKNIRDKLKYFLIQIKNNWKDWTWWYYEFTNTILPIFYRFRKNNGIYIMDQKWDNLIILDACRYDIFEKTIKKRKIKGELKKVISRGSTTVDFLKENFKDKKFLDTIYVTANPYVYFIKNSFYKTIDLWYDLWDEKLNTVHPKIVNEEVLKIKKKYPNKKLIIHYMQPHCPFIGEYKKKGFFWQVALKEGRKETMKAYTSNLEFVLSYVEDLIKELNSITIITADHGNACGEGATFLRIPIYSHPKGMPIPSLIEVPWFVIDNKR